MGIEQVSPNGRFLGNEREDCLEYLGIPYAKADRFAYAKEIEAYPDQVDATKFGPACPQYRQFFPHLDVPERKFYQREFRDGLTFDYDEDCLNLNIYTPKEKDIIYAEKVIREIEDKKAKGIGVFTVDGKMIDIAFYDGAKRTIALAKASGVYKGDL